MIIHNNTILVSCVTGPKASIQTPMSLICLSTGLGPEDLIQFSPSTRRKRIITAIVLVRRSAWPEHVFSAGSASLLPSFTILLSASSQIIVRIKSAWIN
jgi:hypothetical protein